MLQLFPDGSGREVLIGTDILAGQQPQVIVPPGVWQGISPRAGGRVRAPGCDDGARLRLRRLRAGPARRADGAISGICRDHPRTNPSAVRMPAVTKPCRDNGLDEIAWLRRSVTVTSLMAMERDTGNDEEVGKHEGEHPMPTRAVRTSRSCLSSPSRFPIYRGSGLTARRSVPAWPGRRGRRRTRAAATRACAMGFSRPRRKSRLGRRTPSRASQTRGSRASDQGHGLVGIEEREVGRAHHLAEPGDVEHRPDSPWSRMPARIAHRRVGRNQSQNASANSIIRRECVIRLMTSGYAPSHSRFNQLNSWLNRT